VKVGDLVKYSNQYTNDIIYGVVCHIEYSSDCPYKVRWQCHTDSMRCYYSREELIGL